MPGSKAQSTDLVWTVEDAAKQLGISRNLCYEQIRQGNIPVLRIGGRIVIGKAALNGWINSNGATK